MACVYICIWDYSYFIEIKESHDQLHINKNWEGEWWDSVPTGRPENGVGVEMPDGVYSGLTYGNQEHPLFKCMGRWCSNFRGEQIHPFSTFLFSVDPLEPVYSYKEIRSLIERHLADISEIMSYQLSSYPFAQSAWYIH